MFLRNLPENMTKNNFKKLILISASLYAVLIFISSHVPLNISAELFEMHRSQVSAGFYGHTRPLVDYAMTLTLAFAAFGLYTFKKWAPVFAVFATFFSFIPYLLIGTVLKGSLTMIVLGCMDLVWGAVLMLSFLEPYDKWFKGE
jgi:uncharacterized membrane protein